MEDFERGYAEDIKPYPWQTCTCIGDWHYNRDVFLKNRYKTAGQVLHQLIDIVSKNGNLLLSIPLRADGTIDSLEENFLDGMSKWMAINSEAIFDTRPWKIYGEGPNKVKGGMFNEGKTKFTAEDIRFTVKGQALYALLMGWPEAKKITIGSLAANGTYTSGKITGVSLLGYKGKLVWSQTAEGLLVTLPATAPCEHAFVLKITGATGKK